MKKAGAVETCRSMRKSAEKATGTTMSHENGGRAKTVKPPAIKLIPDRREM
jgi:hypothetical protein